MDIDDIKDRESLEAWLKTRPREDVVAIAHRAALRVFPLFGREMGEQWARKRAFTCLHILRPLVVSGTIGKRTIPSISAGTRSHKPSADYAVFAAFSAARFAHSTASTMFAASAVDAAAPANAARFNVLAYGDLASKAYSIWHEVRRDASLVVKGQGINQSPLWPDTPPDWFTEADQETRAIWTENPAHWEFWTRWWDAAIAGTPLDWDLQRDIALIPDYVWKQGPGAVAIEIARVEELHALRRELAELKRRIEQPEQVIEAVAGADLRGHNNPPELIETPAELRETLVVVWEELREAEREVAKPLPEPGRLRRNGQAILSAAKSIAAYCLEVGDVVVKNAAKAVGAALGVGIVAAILSNLPAIMSFAEKLITYGTRWLP